MDSILKFGDFAFLAHNFLTPITFSNCLKMEKILVTGGSGFIGSHTVDKLIEKGYKVVVLDNLEKQVHLGKNPKYNNPEAKYIAGDVRFKKHWIKALEGVTGVIHLAGAVGIGQSFWQARKYIDVNAGATATLFEILITDKKITKNIEKITVASSKSLYGEGSYSCQNHGEVHPLPRNIEQLKEHKWEIYCPYCGEITKPVPVNEDKPPQNLNPYSLSKYATERIALSFADVLNIPTVALRYFNVYGPRQSLSNPYTGVVAIFLSRLKNNNSPYIFEDGNQLRDYIYVKDVANINVQSLEHGYGAYNVGTGTPHSLRQVVGILNENLGTDIPPIISNEFRPGDNRHDFADIKKLKRDFQLPDFVNFKEGMLRLVEESQKINAKDYFEKQEQERKKFLGKN